MIIIAFYCIVYSIPQTNEINLDDIYRDVVIFIFFIPYICRKTDIWDHGNSKNKILNQNNSF